MNRVNQLLDELEVVVAKLRSDRQMLLDTAKRVRDHLNLVGASSISSVIEFLDNAIGKVGEKE